MRPARIGCPAPEASEIEGSRSTTACGPARRVLRGLDLAHRPRRGYGLVGESGCGKSTAAFAAVPLPAAQRLGVSGGRIMVDGRDLMGLTPAELRELRAQAVAMVYQDPGRALNPSIRIGRQVAEVFELAGMSGATRHSAARSRCWRACASPIREASCSAIRTSSPAACSSGSCIAMALASDPALLILDEPTTGLDVTVEAEVLDLIAQLRREFDTSILFISHNLGRRGEALRPGRRALCRHGWWRRGRRRELFERPRHPYTVGLLRCLPRRGRRKATAPLDTIPGSLPARRRGHRRLRLRRSLRARRATCRGGAAAGFDLGRRALSRCFHHDRRVCRGAEPPQTAGSATVRRRMPIRSGDRQLSKTFERGKGHRLAALRDDRRSLDAGETLGLVGESGSGKTTLARLVLGLWPPDPAARSLLDGKPLAPR